MKTDKTRTEFEVWAKTHYYLSELGLDFADDEYVDMEVQGAFEAYQVGRAAMQTQEQPIPYAGVTVWVGNKRYSHGVTKDELELSTFDILQAAFDHARRVEENK